MILNRGYRDLDITFHQLVEGRLMGWNPNCKCEYFLKRLIFYVDSEKYSWVENYAGSSGLVSSIAAEMTAQSPDGQEQPRVLIPVGQLEMDLWGSKVGFCPLLAHPEMYSPDTVDLTQDHEAR